MLFRMAPPRLKHFVMKLQNLKRVILLSMCTRSTILGEMWGEMLLVFWGMGEIMDDLKVL